MKKVEIKSIGIQLNENEINKTQQCLKYCLHRWLKHGNSGIRKAISLMDLETLIKDINSLENTDEDMDKIAEKRAYEIFKELSC